MQKQSAHYADISFSLSTCSEDAKFQVKLVIS